MIGRLLLSAALLSNGCATALREDGVAGDAAALHDATSSADGADASGGDGARIDAKDTDPIFETEGDAPGDTRVDSSPVDGSAEGGDGGIDAKVDAGSDSGLDSGIDSGPTACGTAAPKVLFYTIGNKEQPYLPTGAVTTLATDASWRAMTTADFQKFQLIVIGEGGTLSGGASPWQTAFDTKATWTPAVTGRIVITTLDPVAHVGISGVAGASTFIRTALQWAASGPGPGLYIGPDFGWRKLDYLSGFGTFSAAGMIAPDSVSGDDVHVVVPTSALMSGSTDASLSSWSISYHGAVTGFPASFTAVAASRSTPSRSVVVARDVACPP